MKAVPADLHAVCERMRVRPPWRSPCTRSPTSTRVGAAAGMIDVFAQLGASARRCTSTPAEELPFESYLLADWRRAPRAAAARARRSTPSTAARCRASPSSVDAWDGFVVDIDHHHDNAHFGDLVLLRPQASSTSEVVCDIARCLDLTPAPGPRPPSTPASPSTPATSARQHQRAHLQDRGVAASSCGVDVTGIYRELYERRAWAPCASWARAVAGAAQVADGPRPHRRCSRGRLRRRRRRRERDRGHRRDAAQRRRRRGRRAGQGAARRPRVRVSLRSSGADVSAARRAAGGGGHRQAAGFSSDETPEEVTAWLSTELARLLSTASS